MKRILEYLKPVIEDESKQPSRKRILEIVCISTGCVLTSTTCFYKYYNPDLDVATITLLIAPLFVTGTAYSGITSYYQNKTNELSINSDSTGVTNTSTGFVGNSN